MPALSWMSARALVSSRMQPSSSSRLPAYLNMTSVPWMQLYTPAAAGCRRTYIWQVYPVCNLQLQLDAGVIIEWWIVLLYIYIQSQAYLMYLLFLVHRVPCVSLGWCEISVSFWQDNLVIWLAFFFWWGYWSYMLKNVLINSWREQADVSR